MVSSRRKVAFRWLFRKSFWTWFFISLLLIFVRFSKGSFLLDAFSLVSRPFWPGTAQKDWITSSINLEREIRLDLLEKDNLRLRSLLELKAFSDRNLISAAVISRRSRGFWQQLELNKGGNHGISSGDAVLGPGGLLGLVETITPTTSRVRLLTGTGTNIGVWIEKKRIHGVLKGVGTDRTQLNFLEKTPGVVPGDVVSTSPASTLFPPNLPVGVIQTVNNDHLPAPYAYVQLIASPSAIDWVQIRKAK